MDDAVKTWDILNVQTLSRLSCYFRTPIEISAFAPELPTH